MVPCICIVGGLPVVVQLLLLPGAHIPMYAVLPGTQLIHDVIVGGGSDDVHVGTGAGSCARRPKQSTTNDGVEWFLQADRRQTLRAGRVYSIGLVDEA